MRIIVARFWDSGYATDRGALEGLWISSLIMYLQVQYETGILNFPPFCIEIRALLRKAIMESRSKTSIVMFGRKRRKKWESSKTHFENPRGRNASHNLPRIYPILGYTFCTAIWHTHTHYSLLILYIPIYTNLTAYFLRWFFSFCEGGKKKKGKKTSFSTNFAFLRMGYQKTITSPSWWIFSRLLFFPSLFFVL